MSSKHPIILDGGMSRELMRVGAPFRQPEWSALALLEAPHLVQQVHTEFIAAGADVITTNSYALVPFHIGEERFRDRGQELADLAGKLARNAANEEFARSGRKILVAGCLPPIFGSYEPDRYDGGRVQEYLSVLVRGLAPHVDIWLGETLSLIAEAEAVREAVKATQKPLWIAFTVDDLNRDDAASEVPMPPRLRSKEPVIHAARWAVDARIQSLLFNCSQPDAMSQAVTETKSTFEECRVSIPIGVYANGFPPMSTEKPANSGISEIRKDMTVDLYAAFARKWIACGASIVGGCCGIGCEHVKGLIQGLAQVN